MRIECFDISTIHGSYTVASMVVFTGGKPDKNQYRRFKIKTPLDEANDFLSMQEVMSRRYCAERMADERFGSKPDLIILDGGKPQLSAVMEMFDQMGIDDIALCGLAKRDEALRPLAGHGSGRFALGVGVALPREAGARRGPPVRDYLPPRGSAARA